MKNRYDKLIVVRSAASRMASAAFAEASAHLMEQERLARRVADAASVAACKNGIGAASDLATHSELAARMQTALRMTQDRVANARSDHDEAAQARRAARRALDAAIDIRRARDHEKVVQIEAQVVPSGPRNLSR